MGESQAMRSTPSSVPNDPYIPTPPDLVRAKLEFGEAAADDLVFDLGCGDGRVLVMAAQEYGCLGVGVDIQQGVVEEAWSNICDHDLEDDVTVRCEDFLSTDLSQADLVILYLTSKTLNDLSEKLREVRAGTRIVTHDFALAGWPLSEQTVWTSSEGRPTTLYLYRQRSSGERQGRRLRNKVSRLSRTTTASGAVSTYRDRHARFVRLKERSTPQMVRTV